MLAFLDRAIAPSAFLFQIQSTCRFLHSVSLPLTRAGLCTWSQGQACHLCWDIYGGLTSLWWYTMYYSFSVYILPCLSTLNIASFQLKTKQISFPQGAALSSLSTSFSKTVVTNDSCPQSRTSRSNSAELQPSCWPCHPIETDLTESPLPFRLEMPPNFSTSLDFSFQW